MKSKFFRFSRFFLWSIFSLAAISFVVFLLWNWLMPTIFGLVAISYWQALGLFLLARILLGGFGLGHRKFGHKDNPIHRKWAQMTDEQKKEFVERRHHFGFGRHFGDNITNEQSGKQE